MAHPVTRSRIPVYLKLPRAPYNGERTQGQELTAKQLDAQHRYRYPLPYPNCAPAPDNSHMAVTYYTSASNEEILAAGFTRHGISPYYYLETSDASDPLGLTGWVLISEEADDDRR